MDIYTYVDICIYIVCVLKRLCFYIDDYCLLITPHKVLNQE